MRKPFNASIRVVKSLIEKDDFFFNTLEVVREKYILALDNNEVKTILSDKYPSFFPENKVYQKETKDQAQFFYVIIKPLSNYEINQVNQGLWVCDGCGQKHDNKYISRPDYTRKPPFQDLLFCNNDACKEDYIKEYYKDVEMPDDQYHVKPDSLNYIYKCTEKSTEKCYIGKTRNAPFFRWWNHLTHSSSPFGTYMRSTKLSDWKFEVLEELPANISDSEVFKIESEYITKYDSLNNGFNSLISHKTTTQKKPPENLLF